MKRTARLVAMLLTAAALSAAVPAFGQIGHVEIKRGGGAPRPPIYLPKSAGTVPADGTVWKRWYPLPWTDLTQTAYVDNGDGLVSTGDTLTLNSSIVYLITVAAPGYFLAGVSDSALWFPTGAHNPSNPVGESWKEIFPSFNTTRTIDQWIDVDMSGSLSVGDTLGSGFLTFELTRIGDNATVYDAAFALPAVTHLGLLLLLILFLATGIFWIRRARASST
jgi:hypothetical protein